MPTISRRWKIITAVNLLLCVTVTTFMLIQRQNYHNVLAYLGPEGINENYWLHPDNIYVNQIAYVKKGNGYVAETYWNDAGFTINLWSSGKINELVIKENDINKFLLVQNAETKELTFGQFSLYIEAKTYINYRCKYLTPAGQKSCSYFIG